VVETRNGCAQVRDGGILITLGPAEGDDHKVLVASTASSRASAPPGWPMSCRTGPVRGGRSRVRPARRRSPGQG